VRSPAIAGRYGKQAGEIHLLDVNLAVFRAKRGLPGVLLVRMILDEE
jgi:hypothetical protein